MKILMCLDAYIKCVWQAWENTLVIFVVVTEEFFVWRPLVGKFPRQIGETSCDHLLISPEASADFPLMPGRCTGLYISAHQVVLTLHCIRGWHCSCPCLKKIEFSENIGQCQKIFNSAKIFLKNTYRLGAFSTIWEKMTFIFVIKIPWWTQHCSRSLKR